MIATKKQLKLAQKALESYRDCESKKTAYYAANSKWIKACDAAYRAGVVLHYNKPEKPGEIKAFVMLEEEIK